MFTHSRLNATKDLGVMMNKRAVNDQASIAYQLGYESLVPLQTAVVAAARQPRDILATGPGGAGKSTSAALLSHALASPTLLVVPRLTSARDLTERFERHGLLAARLDSTLSAQDLREARDLATAQKPAVLVVAADALNSPLLCRGLARLTFGALVIDDAQATSAQAHEFSPALAKVSELGKRLNCPKVALLSPTPAAVRAQTAQALGLNDPLVFEEPAVRDNLRLERHLAHPSALEKLVPRLLAELRRPGIIFVNTPEQAEKLFEVLTDQRVPSHRYHGQLSAAQRLTELLQFLLPGRKTVMVATSSFYDEKTHIATGTPECLDRAPLALGLGLDKSDLRFVIRVGAPRCLEQYTRELGCAGRDGEPASGILIAEPPVEDSIFLTIADATAPKGPYVPARPAQVQRYVAGTHCPSFELSAALDLPASPCGVCAPCQAPKRGRKRKAEARTFQVDTLEEKSHETTDGSHIASG